MFLYRPTVQAADAREVRPGVQRFFFVLAPAGRRLHRRVRVGRQRMPPPGARFWARIERVGTLQQVLADQLEDERYRTRTSGERFQPGARLIAEGCYAIVRHGDHCHLAYRVEPGADAAGEDAAGPGDDGDGADDADAGAGAPRVPGAGSPILLFERDARGGAVWTAGGEPALLDREGCELVLVGAGDDPEGTLGVDLLPYPFARTLPAG